MRQSSTFMSRGSVGLALLFATAIAAADKPAAVGKPITTEVGAKSPAFEGNTEFGKTWKSGDAVGKKYVVLYFYPADFTTGCIAQARMWRDNLNVLTREGIEVVGVSGDSMYNHKLFKESWKLNFTLLADEDGTIARKFGVPIGPGGRVRPRGADRKLVTDGAGKLLVLNRKATFDRWTFVIGKNGNILYKNTKVNPVRDSKQVLEFIQTLKKQR